MKPLYKDVDVSTMRSMREDQGMSNSEIADALGVARETVWNYLGPGPRKTHNAKRRTRTEPVAAKKPIDEPFSLVSTEVTLTGTKLTYRVHPDKPDVSLGQGGLFDLGSTTFNAEDLDALIEELQYIRRMYMR